MGDKPRQTESGDQARAPSPHRTGTGPPTVSEAYPKGLASVLQACCQATDWVLLRWLRLSHRSNTQSPPNLPAGRWLVDGWGGAGGWLAVNPRRARELGSRALRAPIPPKTTKNPDCFRNLLLFKLFHQFAQPRLAVVWPGTGAMHMRAHPWSSHGNPPGSLCLWAR